MIDALNLKLLTAQGRLRTHDDGDGAASVSQNVLYLGSKVQAALGRPNLHAHYQQVEVAAGGGEEDGVFGLTAGGGVSLDVDAQLLPKARISLVIGVVLAALAP